MPYSLISEESDKDFERVLEGKKIGKSGTEPNFSNCDADHNGNLNKKSAITESILILRFP